MELYGPDSGELSALKNIVDYCSRNYTKEISLETLSKELHISKYYISHLFGSRLNMRFNDYVNSLRVSEACRLLRATTMGITDISAQVGFNTLRTFNRSFVKQMGQSPSEYRRRLAATAG
jgi:YesN/AraC family two-component response regulator